MKQILWWTLVTIFGIIIEGCIKGIGPFLPALLLCLQIGNIATTTFLAIFWMTIQEGGGSLPFGTLLLWYLGVTFVFFWMKNYLASSGIIFVVIISICSSLWYLLSIYTITGLEEITINQGLIFHNAIKQLIVFPLLWKIYSYLYYRLILPKEQMF